MWWRVYPSACFGLQKRWLIIQWHNEGRDALGDLASIEFRDVIREPIVKDADPVRGLPALVADLGVRGLWAAQTEALLDIRVMDTDAQSYTSSTVDSVLLSAENEKKKRNTWMLLRLDMHLLSLLSPQLMVSLLVKLTLS